MFSIIYKEKDHLKIGLCCTMTTYYSEYQQRKVTISELDPDLITPSIVNHDIKVGGSKLAIIGKPGCFSKGTKIMMFDGTLKNVEDIKVGDQVMGDDSNVRCVLELCRGEEEMYDVLQDMGLNYRVNKSHVLSLICSANNKVLDISVEDFLSKSLIFTRLHQGYKYNPDTKEISQTPIKLVPAGRDQYYGFTLDENHRFLLSDYTVTHNSGKCLMKDTPVLLYDASIKKVQDVVVGDILLGDDYQPRRVMSTTAGLGSLYTVQQSHGMKYGVNGDHILTVKDRNRELDLNVVSVMNSDYKYQGLKRLPQQISDPQTLNDSKVSYEVIGRYLGSELEDELDDPSLWMGGYQSYSMDLADIVGLYNFQTRRWIPKEYKLDLSFHDRCLLLKGIIIGNGEHFNYRSCYYTVYSEDENFITDIKVLTDSLNLKNEKDYDNHMESHSLKIYWDLELFDIGRSNSDLSIDYYGEGVYYGFELDGNGRFLLGDFTVTHNTTIIKSLFYEKSDIIPVVQAYSGSEDANNSYSEFIPSTYIFNQYDPNAFSKFIERQKLARQYLDNPWAGCIFDDVTADPKILTTPLIQGFYKYGRHYDCLHVLGFQYAMDIKPVIRQNIDWSFLMAEPAPRSRKILYDNFSCASIGDYREFCDLLDAVTGDYTALVIRNNTQSNRIEDSVFWYRSNSEIPPDFKFGCDLLWESSDAKYDSTNKKMNNIVFI